MPLLHFLRYVNENTGVSVIAEERLDGSPVSIDVKDVPISQVLSTVSRRLGVQVTRTGDVYYMGDIRPEDRGVMVRKVVRLKSDELLAAAGTLLSDNGRAVSQTDGIIVVGDKVEVLEKINEMFDLVEQAPTETWVVQLYIISITDRASRTLGMNLTPTLEISAALTNVAGIPTGIDVSGALDGLLEATQTLEGASVEAKPLFLLEDGATARTTNATNIPIPLRQVNENGTVTTTGYEYIEVGLVVEVNLREMGQGRAMLDAQIDLNELLGFVEEAPISRGQTMTTRATLQSGGVYLIGELRRDDTRATVRGIFESVRDDERDAGTIQVWARCYRVAGPVRSSPAAGGFLGEAKGDTLPERDKPGIGFYRFIWPHAVIIDRPDLW